MAKKAAAADFNMSEAIREILTEKPTLRIKEAADAIMAKYPSAKINKGSFPVAFYTGRNKLGIKSSGRGKRIGRRIAKSAAKTTKVDLDMMRSAAKFLSEVGGAEAALAAIKQVQAVQVK